jgi:hypothetical protein
MEKAKLKLYEILALDVELNGFTDQQTGKLIVEGILSKELKLSLKYWLSDLSDKVLKEKESVGKLREALIKKHGTPDDKGGISIQMYINQVFNEAGEMVSADNNPIYEAFQKEYQALLEEDVDIEYKSINLSEVQDIKTKDIPKVFFKLMSKPESE